MISYKKLFLMMEEKEITIKDILYLLDKDRESEEIVILMGDGEAEAKAMVKSEIWQGIEHRAVKAIESYGLRIWLKERS